MKRLLMTAALALLTTTARAEDYAASAEWVHTLMQYNAHCEPLGPNFRAEAIHAFEPIPHDVSQAAGQRVLDYYLKVGPQRFCELTQARIAANHKWLFQTQ
jgi:hypothetical protein